MATQTAENVLGINRHALNSYNHAVALGYVQATVAPATYAAMRAGIIALANLHDSQGRIAAQIAKNLDAAFAAGILTDTNCNVANSATDTVVRAIFTTVDSSLSATEARTFACFG